MIRWLVAPLVAAALSSAPLQCAHDPDPTHCWDDAPGDGLWDLAEKFRDAHDDAAVRQTLEYLVERYPASRHAPAARDWLADAGASPASDPARDAAPRP
jgi:hypothetical protein